jgi:hypothetical protein
MLGQVGRTADTNEGCTVQAGERDVDATTARLKPITVVPVWVASLVAAVLIGVYSPAAEYWDHVVLALGGAIVLTFVLQLATSQKDGLVSRTMLSTCGSLVILAVVTGVLALV